MAYSTLLRARFPTLPRRPRWPLAALLAAAGWAIVISLSEAASPLHPNLVPNPSFERDEDGNGVPDGWAPKALPGGGALPPLPMTSGHTGRHALHFAPKSHMAWQTDVKGINPGRFYLLHFWIKREGWKDGEYPRLQVFGQDIRLNELFSWKAWRKVRRVVRAGEESRTALGFSAQGLAHGFAIDDVELLEIAFQGLRPGSGEEAQSGGPVFSWVLPPSELVIRLEIEISQDPAFRNPTVIELMSPQGSQVRLSHPLARGEWHWRIRAFLAQDEVALSETHTFRAPGIRGSPSPALPPRFQLGLPPLRPPFFPLGFFSARGDPASLIEVREAGFNAVQGSADIEFVKTAARHDLHAIIGVEAFPGEKTLSFVRDNPALPGLLAWYLADEPEGRGISPAALWSRGAVIRRLAPGRPTSLTLLRAEQARYYASAADVVLVDPYPIPTQPLTWLSDSIDEVRSALRPGQSVWAIIQAFSWGGESLYPKERPSRYPAIEEQRAMAFLAVTHGASGIFFFAENYARKDALHWANLKKLGRELRCLLPILGSPAGSLRLVQPNPPLDPKGKPAIHYGEKHLAEDVPASPACPGLAQGRYLLAVNPWRNPHTFRLEGFAPDERRAVPLSGNPALPIVKGELQDKLGPLEVRLWKIAKEN